VAARTQVDRVGVPASLLEAVAKIRTALANQDIRLSDRRFKAAIKVVRATAWLDGEGVADASHLRCLYDICWSQVEQIEPAWREIDLVLDPILLEFDKLAAAIRELGDQIQPVSNERNRRDLANELYDKLMQAERDLDGLEQDHTASPRRQEKLSEMRKALSAVSRRIATELFEVAA
jgi:MoxR-like ATPase